MRTLSIALLLVCSAAQAKDPFGGSWPEGEHRALVGAFCGSCHSLALVSQQRLDRKGWDKLLTWMSKTQNMPVVDTALRSMLLDYLTMNFGPDDKDDQRAQLVQTAEGAQGIDAPPLLVNDD
ncbi:MAG: hypothetical protein AAF004_03035 [Pseudomonadota bacterium]